MIKKSLRKKITRPELDKFIFKHKSDEYTLDLGAKNSLYGHYFKHRVGFDIKKGEGVDVVGDAHKLPFEDNMFDVILCTEVLEHLHDPKIAIAEMNRVLKDKGKLILTTRFIFPIHDLPCDYYRYTKYGLRFLFKDWDIIELREEVGTTKTLAILLQEIALQKSLVNRKFVRGFLLILSKSLVLFSSSEKETYKSNDKNDILFTSGYYLVCRNKKYLD